jgi:hypothetical protein
VTGTEEEGIQHKERNEAEAAHAQTLLGLAGCSGCRDWGILEKPFPQRQPAIEDLQIFRISCTGSPCCTLHHLT